MEMADRKAVLTAAAEAYAAHAGDIGRALDALLGARDEGGIHLAERQLWDALVLLDAGHERSAHDGSTYQARREAARRALAAWDGRGGLRG